MRLGYLLLIAGTVVASLGGAKLPEADKTLSVIGLLLLLASVVVMRMARGSTTVEASQIEAVPGVDLHRLLQGLRPRLLHLQGQAPMLSLAHYLGELEELERAFLRPLSDGFPSLLPSMGAERFAQVAGAYASCERYLSRSWSAAADHHRPEAMASLELGIQRLDEAIGCFDM